MQKDNPDKPMIGLQSSPIIRVTQESPPSSDTDDDCASKQSLPANHQLEQQADATRIEGATTTIETSTTTTTATATTTSATTTLNGNNNNNNNKPNGSGELTHAYKRRFFVLFLFCSHSAINSFQWIEYSSITNVVADYYGASNLQVNLTSLVFMITYIPFIIHASLMLERVGLRKAILLGTVGTAFGSLIKWQLGGQPGMTAFWWTMLGQTVVALSQLYIISIPPLLAAVWFPDSQVSTATGIGVFGNQLGIALGFIVPPLIISEPSQGLDRVGKDLNHLAALVFWISAAISVISCLSLEDKPPKPPGSASYRAAHQVEQKSSSQVADGDTFGAIRQLCKNIDFKLLILSYGINVGVFYAISTVLNQMVIQIWPQLIELAGKLGLLIVVSGMAGSVVCGQLLDRTHAYKAIIVSIYLFSLLSMLLFTIMLHTKLGDYHLWALYGASAVLGFFMTGYLPLGFEFAAEITYPHPANTPAGLLNLSAQVSDLV